MLVRYSVNIKKYNESISKTDNYSQRESDIEKCVRDTRNKINLLILYINHNTLKYMY